MTPEHTAEQLAEQLHNLAGNAADAATHLRTLAVAAETGRLPELPDRWLADLAYRYDTDTCTELEQVAKQLPPPPPPRVWALSDIQP